MYRGQPVLGAKALEPQFKVRMRKGAEEEILLSDLKQRKKGKGARIKFTISKQKRV